MLNSTLEEPELLEKLLTGEKTGSIEQEESREASRRKTGSSPMGECHVSSSSSEGSSDPRCSLSIRALAYLVRVSFLSSSLLSSSESYSCTSSSSSSVDLPSTSASRSPSSSFTSSPTFFEKWHHWWWTWAAVSPLARVLLETNDPYGTVVWLYPQQEEGSVKKNTSEGSEPSHASSSVPSSSTPLYVAAPTKEAVPCAVAVRITRYTTDQRVKEEEAEEVAEALKQKTIKNAPTTQEENIIREDRCVENNEEDKKEEKHLEGVKEEHRFRWKALRWHWSSCGWWSKGTLPKEGWRRWRGGRWNTGGSLGERMKSNPLWKEEVILPCSPAVSRFSRLPIPSSSDFRWMLHVEVALLSYSYGKHMRCCSSSHPWASSSSPSLCHAVGDAMACALQRCSWWVHRSLSCGGAAVSFASTKTGGGLPCSLSPPAVPQLAVSFRGHVLQRRALDGHTARQRRREGRAIAQGRKKKKLTTMSQPAPTSSTSSVPPPAVDVTRSSCVLSQEKGKDTAKLHTSGDPPSIGREVSPYYIFSSRLPIFSLDTLEALAGIALSKEAEAANHIIEMDDGKLRHQSASSLPPPPPEEEEDATTNDHGHPSQEVMRRKEWEPDRKTGTAYTLADKRCFPFSRVHTLFLSGWSFSAEAWRYFPLLFYNRSSASHAALLSCEKTRGGAMVPPTPAVGMAIPEDGREEHQRGERNGCHRWCIDRCSVHGMHTDVAKLFLPSFVCSEEPPLLSTYPSLWALWNASFITTTSSSAISSTGIPLSFPSVGTALERNKTKKKAEERGVAGEEENAKEGVGERGPALQSASTSGTSGTPSSPVSSSLSVGLWWPEAQEVRLTYCGGEAFWMGLQAFLTPPPCPFSCASSSSLVPSGKPLRVLSLRIFCTISPKRFSLLLASIAGRNRSFASSSLYEIEVSHQKLLGTLLLEGLGQYPYLCQKLRVLAIPECGVKTADPLVRWIRHCYGDSAPPSLTAWQKTREEKKDISEWPHPLSPPSSSSLASSPRHYFHYWNLRWNPGANDTFYEACEKTGSIRVGDLWMGGTAGSRGAVHRIADHVSP